MVLIWEVGASGLYGVHFLKFKEIQAKPFGDKFVILFWISVGRRTSGGSVVEICQLTQGDHEVDPWTGKILWSRARKPHQFSCDHVDRGAWQGAIMGWLQGQT